MPRPERAPRKARWLERFRPHSRTEKAAVGAAVIIVASLVIAGLVYTATGWSPPAPPARAAATNNFANTRAARIVVPTEDGLCREYSFSNKNGAFGADRMVPCDDNRYRSSAPNSQGGTGFEAFKQAFGKK